MYPPHVSVLRHWHCAVPDIALFSLMLTQQNSTVKSSRKSKVAKSVSLWTEIGPCLTTTAQQVSLLTFVFMCFCSFTKHHTHLVLIFQISKPLSMHWTLLSVCTLGSKPSYPICIVTGPLIILIGLYRLVRCKSIYPLVPRFDFSNFVSVPGGYWSYVPFTIHTPDRVMSIFVNWCIWYFYLGSDLPRQLPRVHERNARRPTSYFHRGGTKGRDWLFRFLWNEHIHYQPLQYVHFMCIFNTSLTSIFCWQKLVVTMNSKATSSTPSLVLMVLNSVPKASPTILSLFN